MPPPAMTCSSTAPTVMPHFRQVPIEHRFERRLGDDGSRPSGRTVYPRHAYHSLTSLQGIPGSGRSRKHTCFCLLRVGACLRGSRRVLSIRRSFACRGPPPPFHAQQRIAGEPCARAGALPPHREHTLTTQDQQVPSRVAQAALDMPYHSPVCTLPDGRDTAAAGASRTSPSVFIGANESHATKEYSHMSPLKRCKRTDWIG